MGLLPPMTYVLTMINQEGKQIIHRESTLRHPDRISLYEDSYFLFCFFLILFSWNIVGFVNDIGGGGNHYEMK